MKGKLGEGRAIATMAGGLLSVAAAGPVLAETGDLSGLESFRLTPGNAASAAALPETVAEQQGPYDLPDPDRISAREEPDPNRYKGFGRQLGAIKWETAAVFAYYTAINAKKLFRDPVAPHMQRERWFGRDTSTLGVDKLAHAYSTYVVSDILYYRLKRKTGDAPGIALTAAALGSAVGLYTELWDSIEPSGGWSWEDVAFNTVGAGFSVLRNSVPGLDRKLDYRLLIMPNSHFIKASGKEHFEQKRHLLALKLAGFERFEESPLRFVELHVGYYARDFSGKDKARGIEPKRHLFFGVGVNLRELLFKDARSKVGRAAGEALDYLQIPYTAAHVNVTR